MKDNKPENTSKSEVSLNTGDKTSAAEIRQNSDYNETDSPAPNNNRFWEHAANPLSSKGN